MKERLEYLRKQYSGDAGSKARVSASTAIMKTVISQTFASINPIVIVEELAKHYCRAFTSICRNNGLSEEEASELLNEVYLKAKGVAFEENERIEKESKKPSIPSELAALAALMVIAGSGE